MTVAACILAASPESALRDVEGTPNIRRLVELAWAGGALPVVVVAPDPEGSVATALAGTPASLGTPAAIEAGPVGQIVRAITIAADEVEATGAALVWPASFGWLDAETITSLIEAHGVTPGVVIRPAYAGTAGWPVLVPMDRLPALQAMPASLMPDAIADALVRGGPSRDLDVGDPGATHSLAVARPDLPPFAGPEEPAGGHRHEWGSLAASGPDPEPEPPRTAGR